MADVIHTTQVLPAQGFAGLAAKSRFWRGHLQGSEYAWALAFCVPSVQAADGDAEGLPTVVLEAMAAGTPVIGSRHAGIGEAIEHERTGFLVEGRDPEALATALRRLDDEPGLRQRLGGNARTVALDRFDAVKQSQRLEERLLGIIRDRGI